MLGPSRLPRHPRYLPHHHAPARAVYSITSSCHMSLRHTNQTPIFSTITKPPSPAPFNLKHPPLNSLPHHWRISSNTWHALSTTKSHLHSFPLLLLRFSPLCLCLSLGVAPRSDNGAARGFEADGVMAAKTQSVMGSLRVIELQLVAFIMVFSSSGLMSVLDLVFPVFSTLYIFALSRLAFPSLGSRAAPGNEIFCGSRLFQAYVVVGTAVGLFLPLAYVLGGFTRGDDHALRSATPHLFLLSCQILTESLISGLSLFSPPVRAIVPLLYTVRRIFVFVDWNYDVWINKRIPTMVPVKDLAWLWFGRGLAMANLVYFAVNLFGFLIPRFLPRAFERYFRERDEVHSKMAEDKPPETKKVE